jgi:hypothetical protein
VNYKIFFDGILENSGVYSNKEHDATLLRLTKWLQSTIDKAPGASREEKTTWLWANDKNYAKVCNTLSKLIKHPPQIHPAAYDAKLTADKYYIRFGDIPKSGKSWNHLHNEPEKGVSAYPVKWNTGKNKWEIIENELNDGGLASLYELTYNVVHEDNKRPIYIISGQALNDLGQDGEPLLDHTKIKILKKISPADFFSYELGDDWHLDESVVYNILNERYGGSDNLRGVWYHGTSSKYLKSILSQGLLPNTKEKSWAVDPDSNIHTPDRSSYGGIYVSKNLMTAISAARRTAKKTNANTLIVIMELQSKSLVADEDSVVFHLSSYNENQALRLYKILKYGASHSDEQTYLETAKKTWIDKYIAQMQYQYSIHPILENYIRQILNDEGFTAMITRVVSYSTDDWDWKRLWYDGTELDIDKIPHLPTKHEGEAIFRKFADRLTRIYKARQYANEFSPNGRSLSPIRFTGKNKIIAIVEEVDEYKLTIKYGKLPNDFITQWKERVGGDPITT